MVRSLHALRSTAHTEQTLRANQQHQNQCAEGDDASVRRRDPQRTHIHDQTQQHCGGHDAKDAAKATKDRSGPVPIMVTTEREDWKLDTDPEEEETLAKITYGAIAAVMAIPVAFGLFLAAR